MLYANGVREVRTALPARSRASSTGTARSTGASSGRASTGCSSAPRIRPATSPRARSRSSCELDLHRARPRDDPRTRAHALRGPRHDRRAHASAGASPAARPGEAGAARAARAAQAGSLHALRRGQRPRRQGARDRHARGLKTAPERAANLTSIAVRAPRRSVAAAVLVKPSTLILLASACCAAALRPRGRLAALRADAVARAARLGGGGVPADANPADLRDARPPRASLTPARRSRGATCEAEPKPRKPGRLDGLEWWPTYGYDDARTPRLRLLRPPAAVPPARGRSARAHYLEFPPAVAYGRVYVPHQRGRFFAVNAATGKSSGRSGSAAASRPRRSSRDGVVYQALMHRLPCPKWSRASAPRLRGRDGRPHRQGALALPRAASSSRRRCSSAAASTSARGTTTSTPSARATGSCSGASAPTTSSTARPRTRAARSTSAPTAAGSTRSTRERQAALALRSRSRASARREYFYATPDGRLRPGLHRQHRRHGLRLRRRDRPPALGAARRHVRLHGRRRLADDASSSAPTTGSVYALDAATGDVRWRHGAPAAIHGAPTVLDGLVYFATCGTCGHARLALREARPVRRRSRSTRATGERVWSFPDGHYSPVVADRKRVYLAGSTRRLRARRSGAKRSPAASTTASDDPGQAARRRYDVWKHPADAEQDEDRDREARRGLPGAARERLRRAGSHARRPAARRAARAARTGSRRSGRR